MGLDAQPYRVVVQVPLKRSACLPILLNLTDNQYFFPPRSRLAVYLNYTDALRVNIASG
jgi:hypothetical protein